jgi:hypothetical protein
VTPAPAIETYDVIKFLHALLASIAVDSASYGIWLRRAAREHGHQAFAFVA